MSNLKKKGIEYRKYQSASHNVSVSIIFGNFISGVCVCIG